jgi:hypothetical protein
MPGVVEFLDSGHADGTDYIVMALVPGVPWPGLPPESPWEALRPRALALLEVLGRVHAAGVVHRDLKPGNVLVQPDGQVVLIDFGLARGEPLGSTITETGTIMGTPAYLAPEQLGNARSVTAAADLYAFGVMLFQAISGMLPHSTGDLRTLYHQRMNFEAPHLSEYAAEVAPQVAEAVRRCLEREPAARPMDASDVAAVLEGAPKDYLPRHLGAERVDAVMALLQQDGRASIWGPSGSGRSHLVEAVTRTWPGEVVRLRPASKPFHSMAPLVGSLSTLDDVKQAVARALRDFSGLLVADDFERLDRHSQRLLERNKDASLKLLTVAPSEEAVRTAPLNHSDLRALFHGPDRLLHMSEDAATELLRRTDGLARRVERQLRDWENAGIVTRDGDRFRITRKALDRLAAEARPLLLEPAPRELDAELLETVHVVRFAHPHGELENLAALSGAEPFALELDLEELEGLGAVAQVEGRWEPRWELGDPPWSEVRDRAMHRTLASLLAPGTPGRLERLLGAGQKAEAQVEAAAVSRTLEAAGRAGNAIELLQAAVTYTDAPPEVALDRLTELSINRGDKGACEEARALAERCGFEAHRLLLEAYLAILHREAEAAEAALEALGPPPRRWRWPKPPCGCGWPRRRAPRLRRPSSPP